MSINTVTPFKRIGLAVSGLVYIFGAAFVVSQGPLLTAFWLIVGVGLVRQLILVAGITTRWPTGSRVVPDAAETASPTSAPAPAIYVGGSQSV